MPYWAGNGVLEAKVATNVDLALYHLEVVKEYHESQPAVAARFLDEAKANMLRIVELLDIPVDHPISQTLRILEKDKGGAL